MSVDQVTSVDAVASVDEVLPVEEVMSVDDTVCARATVALAGRPLGAGPGRHEAPMGELLGAADLVPHLDGRTVSVCVLPRGDDDRSAKIARVVASDLRDEHGLVAEVTVVHPALSARSVRQLRDAGAQVFAGDDIRTDVGPVLGRGDLVWRALHVTTGDLVVWIDGDLENFGGHVVTGLLAPLVGDPAVALTRPLSTIGARGVVAPPMERSLLARLHPAFAHLHDAIGGEFAVRREVIGSLDLEPDDAVEIGMLADIAARWGPQSIHEVDIGPRTHELRGPLERGRHVRQIIRAALGRLGGPTERGSLPLRPRIGGNEVRESLGR